MKPKISITIETVVLEAIERIAIKNNASKSEIINSACLRDPIIKAEMETKKVNTEEIARVCHQTIKAYRETINDSKKYLDWKDTSQDQKESAYDLVNFVAENIKTISVKNIHDFRRERKKNKGWKVGETKDYHLKTDPFLDTEYEDLSPDDKRKSELFLNIVKALID